MNLTLFTIALVGVIAFVVLASYTYTQILKLTNKLKNENENDEGDDGPSDVSKLVRNYAWFNRSFVLFIVFALGLSCTMLLSYNDAMVTINKKTSDKDSTSAEETLDVCFNRMESVDKTEILIDAIAEIESGDNEKCQNGGALQITKVCIDAANRYSKVKYTYQDRYSKEKSIEVFNVIQKNYNKTGDIERAIRIWNGGPGYTVKGTDAYYNKVIKVYNRKIDERLDKICRQYKSINLY